MTPWRREPREIYRVYGEDESRGADVRSLDEVRQQSYMCQPDAGDPIEVHAPIDVGDPAGGECFDSHPRKGSAEDLRWDVGALPGDPRSTRVFALGLLAGVCAGVLVLVLASTLRSVPTPRRVPAPTAPASLPAVSAPVPVSGPGAANPTPESRGTASGTALSASHSTVLPAHPSQTRRGTPPAEPRVFDSAAALQSPPGLGIPSPAAEGESHPSGVGRAQAILEFGFER